MSIESILSTEMSRGGFLNLLGSGAAAVLIPIPPDILRAPAIETGAILQANIPAEPFYFRSRGEGIWEIGNRFAEAVQNSTGENVHPLIERVTGGFRSALRPDQGICNGVAAYIALKKGLVPEVSSLAGVEFGRDEIMTIGGLLHYGDADREEEYTGDPNQAGFLHFMLLKYLANGKQFIFDFARSPNQMFRTPVDTAWIEEVRDSRRLQGWYRVNVTLRLADYLDPGFDHPQFSRGEDPGYMYLQYVYEVPELEFSNQGEYVHSVFFKSLSRPDPGRYKVTEADGTAGSRSLDEYLPESELNRLKAWKIQGNAFTRRMIELFNTLAGPASSLSCRAGDDFCRP